MTNNTVFIGLDTHKETIAVAIAEDGRDGEVRYYGQIDNQPAAVLKLVKKLASKYDRLRFCYEVDPVLAFPTTTFVCSAAGVRAN
jgi:transposase